MLKVDADILIVSVVLRPGTKSTYEILIADTMYSALNGLARRELIVGGLYLGSEGLFFTRAFFLSLL